MSDNSGDGHSAGPGPHRAAHPSKCAGGSAMWGLGVMPGPGPGIWEQPKGRQEPGQTGFRKRQKSTEWHGLGDPPAEAE